MLHKYIALSTCHVDHIAACSNRIINVFVSTPHIIWGYYGGVDTDFLVIGSEILHAWKFSFVLLATPISCRKCLRLYYVAGNETSKDWKSHLFNCLNPNSANSSIQQSLRLDYILTVLTTHQISACTKYISMCNTHHKLSLLLLLFTAQLAGRDLCVQLYSHRAV